MLDAITEGQIDAAEQMKRALPLWRCTDDALNRLNDCYPGFELDACMVKAAAVNTLYSTNVLAINRMALHLCDVLGREEFRQSTSANAVELVEAISKLPNVAFLSDQLDPDEPPTPPTRRRSKNRQFRSFASKFCAFFVNGDLFPIYDEAAREALKHHLSRSELDSSLAYDAFVANVDCLQKRYQKQYQKQVSLKQIDQYLWLRGMYDRYDNRDRRVNRELRDFFKKQKEETGALLAKLLGVV